VVEREEQTLSPSLFVKRIIFQLKFFKADWKLYRKRAGFLRNVEMHKYLKDFSDRLCICFWNGKSKGTTYNFKLCEKYNTPLIIYDYNKHHVVNASDEIIKQGEKK
jgi:hypothetical protein